jgi:hypothetical protein
VGAEVGVERGESLLRAGEIAGHRAELLSFRRGAGGRK